MLDSRAGERRLERRRSAGTGDPAVHDPPVGPYGEAEGDRSFLPVAQGPWQDLDPAIAELEAQPRKAKFIPR